jgi:hypothetical protein
MICAVDYLNDGYCSARGLRAASWLRTGSRRKSADSGRFLIYSTSSNAAPRRPSLDGYDIIGRLTVIPDYARLECIPPAPATTESLAGFCRALDPLRGYTPLVAAAQASQMHNLMAVRFEIARGEVRHAPSVGARNTVVHAARAAADYCMSGICGEVGSIVTSTGVIRDGSLFFGLLTRALTR